MTNINFTTVKQNLSVLHAQKKATHEVSLKVTNCTHERRFNKLELCKDIGQWYTYELQTKCSMFRPNNKELF